MQKKQLLSGTAAGVSSVDVVEDMTLSKNDCMIETDGGIFDCSLGTQLTELKQKLMLLAWSREE
jgi:flagellar assembly protein FliH